MCGQYIPHASAGSPFPVLQWFGSRSVCFAVQCLLGLGSYPACQFAPTVPLFSCPIATSCAARLPTVKAHSKVNGHKTSADSGLQAHGGVGNGDIQSCGCSASDSSCVCGSCRYAPCIVSPTASGTSWRHMVDAQACGEAFAGVPCGCGQHSLSRSFGLLCLPWPSPCLAAPCLLPPPNHRCTTSWTRQSISWRVSLVRSIVDWQRRPRQCTSAAELFFHRHIRSCATDAAGCGTPIG